MDNFEFTDNSVAIKGLINNALNAFLTGTAKEIVSQTKRNSRVGTSQTKNSYDYVISREELTATIGSQLENAIWEEFGTGEYALDGDGRKTAWYIPCEKYKGKKKPTYQGKVTIVYGKDGKTFYKTDGKKPNRPLYNAVEKVKPNLQKALETKLKGVGGSG